MRRSKSYEGRDPMNIWNDLCVFETQNRMKMMEEIRRVMPHIKDSDMEDIAGQVLEKLEGMNDKEFAELVLEAAE